MTSLVMGNDTTYQGPGLKLIAGVGVMFENRRRNKFAGFINERNAGVEGNRRVQIEIMESLGNCPKYINTRQLVPNPNHRPVVLHKELSLPPGALMPKETIKHISQADAIFLATRYTSPTQTIFKSHLGINIRGGKPGFLRIATENERQVAYLPDYSGNRFMSSLGNIHTDGVAGITVPLMKKGQPIDVVYLTGDAEVLIGKESSKIFPGVNTCVRIELTGFMHVQDAVPLMPGEGVEDFEAKGEDGIGWSPYNPPVRRLLSEISTLADPTASTETPVNEAIISAFEEHSSNLATFTFSLTNAIHYRAGQHIILDCSSLLDPEVREYKHMSDKRGGEKELNDAGVRTWTISSAPKGGEEGEKEVKVTMRRVEGGSITPKLFKLGQEGGHGVKLPVLGVGGDFVLPPDARGKRLLWVASGVGITPFLSFLRSLTQNVEFTLIVAVRRAEVKVMMDLIRSATPEVGILDLHVVSSGVEESNVATGVTRHNGRLGPELLLSICGEEQDKAGEAWVCGPPAFETMIMQTLEKAGWPAEYVHRESFAF